MKKFPRLAYIPARLPAGYHYAGHSFTPADSYGNPAYFNLYFSRAGAHTRQLVYWVVLQPSCDRLPAQRTFTVNGVKVSYHFNGAGSSTFRCLTKLVQAGAARKLGASVSTSAMTHILVDLKRIS